MSIAIAGFVIAPPAHLAETVVFLLIILLVANAPAAVRALTNR